jgi:tRNA(Ile2) C34 agmatinyltransferase TiaS
MDCDDCGASMEYLGDCWECPRCGNMIFPDDDEE